MSNIHSGCLVEGTIRLRSTGGRYSVCERSVGMLSGTSKNTGVSSQVYLQQNKKKAEAKGRNCHAKTMWGLEKPI
jgi:hypothetical protein